MGQAESKEKSSDFKFIIQNKEPIILSDWSKLLLGLCVIAGFILGFVFSVRYEFSMALFITWLISIAIPIIICYHINIRFSKPLVLFIVLVFYFFLISVPIGKTYSSSDTYTGSPNSSSSSENQYCSKHKRMYNPNNAWHGCPDCAKEQDQKNMEKAIKKASRL